MVGLGDWDLGFWVQGLCCLILFLVARGVRAAQGLLSRMWAGLGVSLKNPSKEPLNEPLKESSIDPF